VTSSKPVILDPPVPSTLGRDLWNVPNALTFARIGMIPLVCFLMLDVSPERSFAAMLVLSAAAITDWLDGWLARRNNLVSMTGKFLDPLADKLLVLAVFCTLLAQERLALWFVIVALSRELGVTSLRALAAGEGMIIAAEAGGKWKTVFQLVGLILVLWREPWLPVIGRLPIPFSFESVGMVLLMISLALSLWSAGSYLVAFGRAIASPSSVGVTAAGDRGPGGA
jgi:CDP-diacylglycerol--glycerol-3-phosphate 3-phosphatidyltransferase